MHKIVLAVNMTWSRIYPILTYHHHYHHHHQYCDKALLTLTKIETYNSLKIVENIGIVGKSPIAKAMHKIVPVKIFIDH